MIPFQIMIKAIFYITFLLAIISPLSSQTNNGEGLELMIQSGHTSFTTDICFSNSGAQLLSSSYDGTIRLWDVKNGKLLRVYKDHTKPVTSISFTADDKFIISGSKDSTVKIIETISGEVIFNKKMNNEIWAVDCSANGRYFAFSGNDPNVYLFDIKTKKQIKVLSRHTHKVCKIIFSPDSKTIATAGNDGYILLWEAASGTVLKTHFENQLVIDALDFSPKGSQIVFSSSLSKKTGVWNYEKDFTLYNLPSSAFHEDVKYSPDGKKIALLSGNDINIVNSISGESFFKINEKIEPKSIGFSPDGRVLAIGNYKGGIKLIGTENGNLIHNLKSFTHKITEIAISDDNKILVSGNTNDEVVVWNFSNSKGYKVFNGHSDYAPIKITSDNQHIVTVNEDEQIYIRNINTGLIKVRYDFDGGYINDFDISDDGKELAVACEEGLFLFELYTGNVLKKYDGHGGSVNSVSFIPKEDYLISGGDDNLVKLWAKNNSSEIKAFYGSQDHIKQVIVTPDKKYCIASGDSPDIHIWDYSTGQYLAKHNDKSYDKYTNISNMSFSPNGRTLLYSYDTYYLDKGNLQALDISTVSLMKRFKGEFSHIFSSLFSEKGKFVFTSSKDGVIRLWDSNEGTLLASLISYGKNDWVVLSEDGRFDGTERGMNLLYYVDGLETLELANLFEEYYAPNLIATILNGGKINNGHMKLDELKPRPLVEIKCANNNFRGVTPLGGKKQTQKKQIEIIVKVTDKGGGIDEILLYQNGKLIETDKRGFKQSTSAGEVSRRFTVTLTNGKNTFKATAFNKQRTEANPATLTINFEGEKLSKPNLFLVSIGINKYKNPRYELNYAIADAFGFKSELEKGTEGIFESVQTVYLTDSDANKQSITEEMKKITGLCKQNDVFIFYYAGHGIMSEEEKALFYIVPYDVTQMYGADNQLQDKGISAEYLKQFSSDIKAQKQLYILDACQSGGMINLLASRGVKEEKALMQLARSTGTYWLAASNSEQLAGEFASLKHGIFTYCILEGLSGKADTQNDNNVTVQELSAYLNKQVPVLSEKYKGSVQYPNSFGFGHDFPIILVK